MSRAHKAPLYRKVNTLARGVHHDRGGDARHLRNTKTMRDPDARPGRMRHGARRGLDYTPLYRFLLSKVGQEWDPVHAEAVARLDREDPVWHLVARSPEERQSKVRTGEASWWSVLFIDDDGRLAMVDTTLDASQMIPDCACCTHTFNGIRFGRQWRTPE